MNDKILKDLIKMYHQMIPLKCFEKNKPLDEICLQKMGRELFTFIFWEGEMKIEEGDNDKNILRRRQTCLHLYFEKEKWR